MHSSLQSILRAYETHWAAWFSSKLNRKPWEGEGSGLHCPGHWQPSSLQAFPGMEAAPGEAVGAFMMFFLPITVELKERWGWITVNCEYQGKWMLWTDLGECPPGLGKMEPHRLELQQAGRPWTLPQNQASSDLPFPAPEEACAECPCPPAWSALEDHSCLPSSYWTLLTREVWAQVTGRETEGP